MMMPIICCQLLLSLPIVFLGMYGDAARTDQISISHWANNLKRHSRRASRPCFICPGSSMISPDRYDTELYNGVDAHHDGAVRMPEPIIRPCLYSNKYQKEKMKTQVVLGPQPGTVLDQGTHRVVVKVAYQLDDSDNNITDRSVALRRHAYCRYNLQVMPSASTTGKQEESRDRVRLCRPPPSPKHGRVTCSSVGDDVSITTCRYTCDDGYVTPKTDRHLIHQNWDCYGDPGTSRPPKCIKLELPVPLDLSQCSGLNLTVPDFEDVHLALPKFQAPTTNDSAVYVTCDVNVVQSKAFSNGSNTGSPLVFKRFCVAKNNETDAKSDCNYEVQLNLDPASGRTVMFAEFRFQLGHLLPTSTSNSWCDDRVAVEKLMEAAKMALLHHNAEACQTANCSLLTAQCHHEMSSNKSIANAVLNLSWTVAASYQPFSYDDYFYEGSEVPEGEMLIEKIKAETEVLIQKNADFRKKLEAAGGDLFSKSFQLAKLDLICPLPGYVVNASTNNCQKCPVNTFQLKGSCQLCPARTYQDRVGQTECRPCPNRPSVIKSSEHFNSRCQHRINRPVHASIVALTKLPHRKSLGSASTIQTGQFSSTATLGKIAAGHTFSNHDGKQTSSDSKYTKYKNRRHHSNSYQLATGRTAVSRNSLSTTNDTTVDSEDPCWPNPCLAGGTCFRSTRYADNSNRIISTFKCSCRVGTKGIHCETPYCPTLYCLNGGTCHVNRKVKGHLGRDFLNCTCPLRFTGARCEHRHRSHSNHNARIRHSRHHRQNGSLRSDVARVDKTIIEEAAGLMGTYCASNPCKNGGRCVDNSHAAPGYFTCFCPPNFQGELCDYTPCPAPVARTFCPSTSFRFALSSVDRDRKIHPCWIQTSTGHRQCWSPQSNSPTAFKSAHVTDTPHYETS